MRIEEGFQQASDKRCTFLRIKRVYLGSCYTRPVETTFEEVEPDLVHFGDAVITTVRDLGAGAKIYPPQLVQYDQWGRRVDELQTSEGWRDLKAAAQKEGIPGIFYERKHREFSRIYGFAKVILMVGDSQEVFCPLSMTDGTARIIELIGNERAKKDIFPRLISRDPAMAFTAGQWMTERPGGSDVSLTETNAKSTGESTSYGPKYVLDGFKWFSSATDSEVSVALARTGTLEQGSRGLSLFLIPLRRPLFPSPSSPKPSPTSNNIFVHRLKNKIGTHALPTAELSLQETEGYLLGDLGKGVKNITPVLNITRVWSSTCSLGNLRKCLAMATSYASARRIQSGKMLLKDAPIHVAQLAEVNLLYRALSHLVFGVISLLGKAECGEGTKEQREEVERRLRVLTPVVKAYAAEKACTGMEEAMACLGGAGYMEENGFGRSIRDALVEKIWEGTVTVLALDLARSAADPKNMEAFISWARSVVASTPSSLVSKLNSSFAILDKALAELSTTYTGKQISPLVPRPTLLLVGSIASSVYLLEHAIWSYNQREREADIDVDVFARWIVESGLEANVEVVRKAKDAQLVKERVKANERIVFGTKL
ncbi:Putative acyl-CoA dehydrogenase AidB [Leucoagaricus sp. SymC.cos]|nr:Putative acyl-CoA dehydrogenase AidB [Leucoagaricus sp. SymC.cos]